LHLLEGNLATLDHLYELIKHGVASQPIGTTAAWELTSSSC
jgi:hypothetical protein